MSSDGLWICNCQRYCGGINVNVCKATYYNHRPYRNTLPSINPALLLAYQTGTATAASTSSPSLELARGLDTAETTERLSNNNNSQCAHTEGISDKRPRLHPDFEQAQHYSSSFDQAPPAAAPGNGHFLDMGAEGGNDEDDVPSSPAGRPINGELPNLAGAHEDHVDDEDDEDLLPPVLYSNRPVGEEINDDFIPRTEDLRIALEFKRALEAASLDNGDLDAAQIHALRNPTQQVLTIDDRDLLLSLKLFISTSNSSNQTYTDVRADIMDHHPEDAILSHAAVKKAVAKLTGVSPIVKDMCPNSCIAYTGPYSPLESCPYCDEPRYDPVQLTLSHGRKKIPRQHFLTIPLGPQLQALQRTDQGVHDMGHRMRCTREILDELERNNGVIKLFNDIYHGRAYLEAVARGDIRTEDMVLMFSMDGAQLYRDKQSDCWIYIWIVFDLSPDLRYKRKRVLPGGFIPGPNNPKNPDSFSFTGFHHLAALQKEGLRVWNASTNEVFISYPFLHLGGADGPGSTHFTGLVGHQGAYPCRLYCDVKGRHKPGGPHYYPALLKPVNYDIPGCSHDDIHPSEIRGGSSKEYAENLNYLLNSRNPTDYKQRRKDTGISSISIFSGLPSRHRLPLPLGFPGDSMHVPTLNLGELLPPLWRGMFQCAPTDDITHWGWAVLVGDVWKDHGAAVAKARPYIPGCYDRPPRNIAEKISSGYKAKEWQSYFYGLAPALLHNILPKPYWQNFCKLVHAIRILHQRTIPRTQLQDAHRYLQEFHEEFELLYCQRRTDRLHFMRPCLHALLHLASETVRLGPVPLYSTWTMERVIGDLGGEIKQPSNPYQNLSERGVRRCQINALKASFPALDHIQESLPQGALDIGGGYVLLRAKDSYAQNIVGHAGHVIRSYLLEEEEKLGNHPPADWIGPKVVRWARLRLPTGQVARSAWKENTKSLDKLRRSRCVKVSINGDITFADVEFYFNAIVGGTRRHLTLVSRYGLPDNTLFRESFYTVWSIAKLGIEGLSVIEAKSIQAVVSIQPHDHHVMDGDTRYFVWEQMGLEMTLLSETLPLEAEDVHDNNEE
ncbi:hypothetical protein D9615_001883 [Tricholomella constricta]|uniref:Uncharacterized protein n=1 Tax=Tricholomella constricta TaxID=117010 RepID=A0A8H5HPK0_9AGAR|nr:hypothetical protein D9615_001883 [Tricholomella constricta]